MNKKPKVHRSSYRSTESYQAMTVWYDTSLAQLPIGYESCKVPTPYGYTHVLITGADEADQLVLLPGWGGNAVGYKLLIQELAKYFHVYAIDPVGFTGKSSPIRLNLEGLEYGQWLLDVLDEINIERACFVGISGGSWILLKLASIAPRKIWCSTLVNPLGFVPLRFPYNLSHIKSAEYFVNLFLSWVGKYDPVLDLLFKIPGAPDDEAKDEALLLFKYCNIFLPPKPLCPSEQKNLDTPVIILVGEKEIFYSRQRLIQQVRRTLPKLLYAKVVSGAGHYIHRECPHIIASHSKTLVKWASE